MTKILLLDDSKFLRMARERARLRAGYEVTTAGDGMRAIEWARKEQPDLILLDRLLPKMNGLDVLKALKKDPLTKAIAVVAFTGLSQRNFERLKKDGAVAFLDKADLGLDRGSEGLLAALAGIVRDLAKKLPVVARQAHVGRELKTDITSPFGFWVGMFRLRRDLRRGFAQHDKAESDDKSTGRDPVISTANKGQSWTSAVTCVRALL